MLQQCVTSSGSGPPPSSDNQSMKGASRKLLFTTLTALNSALKSDPEVPSMGQAIQPHLQAAFALTNGDLNLTPIRKVLASCCVLLYTKCRNVDVYGLIKELNETSCLTGRSAKSTSGCRLLAVETLGTLLSSPLVLSRISSLLPESLTALGKCCRSNDVNIKISSLNSIARICDALVLHHTSSSNASKLDSPFVALGGLEEKEIVEILKIVKRGGEDKNGDVR